jgi:hypothetical protein
MSDETELVTRFDHARIGWGAVSMAGGLAVAVTIKTNQIGPRSLWASDACADPAHFCGQIPLAAPVSVGIAMALLWLGWGLLAVVESRGGVRP